ncbi:unnamed protein product [Enterobius vermicularis]|uniref:limulus clotting factor C n=1 Tax=Enterobius vermicularis TaxID=51028 RepID=A0A0N4VF30_ENTVE|nr:unnamed protein product [Enterobius vermicularis]
MQEIFSVGWASAQNCGKTPIPPKVEEKHSVKIVGGTPAVPYSWPWQVELCTKSKTFYTTPVHFVSWGTCELYCGGTLIAPEWVMSAAHCVSVFHDGYEDSPEFFGVKLGTYKYYDTNEDGEMIRDVEKIYKHPKYKNPKRYSNDISLIHVRKSSITASKPRGPVNYTDHIQPICLPKSVKDIVVEGKLAYVTGWGATSEGGDVSDELRQVHVPFLNMSHCKKEYPGRIDETMECAGAEGKDSCQGDSGGPLVTKHDNNGRWYQAGIVSWGSGCAEAGYAAHPTVGCKW